MVHHQGMMPGRPDTTKKAAGLRERAWFAARAGRRQEAHAALLRALVFDPHNVSTLSLLAATSPSESDAERYRAQARQLDSLPSQPGPAEESIHPSSRRKPLSAKTRAGQVPRPRVREATGEMRRRAAALVNRAGGPMVRVVWRLFGILLLLVSVIFFEALLLELGREGGLQALPTAVPSAAGFTVSYLQGLAHGDLGLMASSYRNLPGKPMAAELARALPISMGLLAAALAFAVVVGLLLGTAAALRRARRSSGLILFASAVGFSTPSFFAAMLLIWSAVWLYRTTGRHVLPIYGVGWDAHIILPALVLAARPTATVTRLCCNAIVEVLETDYVRTAIAKGLRPRLVFLRHALRNAGVPILTTIGVSIRFGLAALPIVEYIFSWPGIGSGLLKAVQAQDTTAVVGMSLPLVLFFVLVNLLLDLFYPLVDPRLRASKGA